MKRNLPSALLILLAASSSLCAAPALWLCTFGRPESLQTHHEIEIPCDLLEPTNFARFDLPAPARPTFCDLDGLHVRTFEYYHQPQDLMMARSVCTNRYLPNVPVVSEQEWDREFPPSPPKPR